VSSAAAALPPENTEAEVGVIGAVLLAPTALSAIAQEVRLKPDHFYRDRHRLIWRAILTVGAAGDPVDALTVCEQLRIAGELDEAGGQAYVYSLPSLCPSAGHVRRYARIVHEKAVWRERLDAGRQIAAAALEEDQDAFHRAEAMMVHSDEAAGRTSTPDDVAQCLLDLLEGPPPETFEWPFPRLNKLTMGGMRRGQVTLKVAHTSHGKSAFLDQVLGHVGAQPGLRAHLYFNEGAQDERVQRLAARLARVTLTRIQLRHLDQDERGRIAKAMNRIPFGITDCSGWTADEIVRDMVHKRYDVVGIDTLGRIPGARRRETLEEISRLFNEAVTPTRANCHLIVAHHPNRNRAGTDMVLPFPALSDIRDSGRLADDVDNVLFLHRDQDADTGEPMASGVMRFAKVRNGRLGGLRVSFEADFQRFEGQAFDTTRLRAAA
jgi:replicative DNA helicase